MNDEGRLRNPIRVHPLGSQSVRRRPGEESLEARLRQVRDRVGEFSAENSSLWLLDPDRMCQVVAELRMKLATANWMYRVAQRFSGSGREAIVSSIQEFLDGLEMSLPTESNPPSLIVRRGDFGKTSRLPVS